MDGLTIATLVLAIFTAILALATILIVYYNRELVKRSDKQREFELKRAVYFELLDILSKIINKLREINDEEELNELLGRQIPSIMDDEEILYGLFSKRITDLNIMELKIQLCHGPKEIIDIVKSIKEQILKNPHHIYDIVENKLIPELRNDLVEDKTKHWWQF